MKPFVWYAIIASLAMISAFGCLIIGILRLKQPKNKFIAIGLIIISIPLFYASSKLSVKSDQLKFAKNGIEQNSTK
jgi:hypothetical protein